MMIGLLNRLTMPGSWCLEGHWTATVGSSWEAGCDNCARLHSTAYCYVGAKLAERDPDTGHVTVSHPLRQLYYTTVSVVLFFAPLFIMTLTYSLPVRRHNV